MANRRKQSDQAVKESQLKDRAAQRSNTTMINFFHKSSVAIQLAHVSQHAHDFQQEWRYQQDTEVSVHLSHRGEDATQEMMENALGGGGFEQAIQQHINTTGMMPEPSAVTEAEWQFILDNRAVASGATATVVSGATNAPNSTNTMEVAVGDGSAAPIGIKGIDAVLEHAGLREAV